MSNNQKFHEGNMEATPTMCNVSILGHVFTGTLSKMHRTGGKRSGYTYWYDVILYNTEDPKEATEHMAIQWINEKFITILF